MCVIEYVTIEHLVVVDTFTLVQVELYPFCHVYSITENTTRTTEFTPTSEISKLISVYEVYNSLTYPSVICQHYKRNFKILR